MRGAGDELGTMVPWWLGKWWWAFGQKFNESCQLWKMLWFLHNYKRRAGATSLSMVPDKHSLINTLKGILHLAIKLNIMYDSVEIWNTSCHSSVGGQWPLIPVNGFWEHLLFGSACKDGDIWKSYMVSRTFKEGKAAHSDWPHSNLRQTRHILPLG